MTVNGYELINDKVWGIVLQAYQSIIFREKDCNAGIDLPNG